MATPPTVDSRSQFTLVLTQAPEVEGGQVMVTPEAFVGPGVTPAAVEQAQATADAAEAAAAAAQGDATQALADADAAQQDATQALADAAVVWVPCGFFTDGVSVISPPSAIVAAPVTGTLTHVLAVASAQPNANVVITATNSGGAVTDGVVTILSTDPGNTVRQVTPTAGNAVTLGTSSIAVTPVSTNTSTIVFSVLLGFTRAPA